MCFEWLGARKKNMRTIVEIYVYYVCMCVCVCAVRMSLDIHKEAVIVYSFGLLRMRERESERRGQIAIKPNSSKYPPKIIWLGVKFYLK